MEKNTGTRVIRTIVLKGKLGSKDVDGKGEAAERMELEGKIQMMVNVPLDDEREEIRVDYSGMLQLAKGETPRGDIQEKFDGWTTWKLGTEFKEVLEDIVDIIFDQLFEDQFDGKARVLPVDVYN